MACEPGQLRQGEILRSFRVPVLRYRRESASDERSAYVDYRRYPWIVILSQDCDLEQDYLARNELAAREGREPVRADKELQGVIVSMAYPAIAVKSGSYREGASRLTTAHGRMLEQHRLERYGYIQRQAGSLNDDLAVDFKEHLTIPPDYLYAELGADPSPIIGRLDHPWREQLSFRFWTYVYRVALPDIEESTESALSASDG